MAASTFFDCRVQFLSLFVCNSGKAALRAAQAPAPVAFPGPAQLVMVLRRLNQLPRHRLRQSKQGTRQPPFKEALISIVSLAC